MYRCTMFDVEAPMQCIINAIPLNSSCDSNPYHPQKKTNVDGWVLCILMANHMMKSHICAGHLINDNKLFTPITILAI